MTLMAKFQVLKRLQWIGDADAPCSEDEAKLSSGRERIAVEAAEDKALSKIRSKFTNHFIVEVKLVTF